jgi:hypothetical protein
LSEALRGLLAEGQVVTHRLVGTRGRQETPFYTIPEFRPEPAGARIEALLVHYRLHAWITESPGYCSEVLERAITASFQRTGFYERLERIPVDAPLDDVYAFNGHRIGVEAKNVREWIYPMSGRVWVMVRKCLEIDAVPLLVCRKVGYLTHVFFSRLGMLAFEVHRQVFSPLVEPYLVHIRHTDELGYKDVITIDPTQPLPHLVTFLTKTLPAHIEDYHERWRSNRELMRYFAVEMGLGDPRMSDPQRERHYRAFASAVLYPPREEEADPDDPDDEVPDY